jgi:hypothetical protein
MSPTMSSTSTATAFAVPGLRAGHELVLGEGQVAELRTALARVHRAGIPLIGLGRHDVALPTIGPAVERLGAGLEDGSGYAVLRGIEVDRFSATDLRILLWGIGRHLGVAVSQDADGRLLTEVGRGSGCRGTAGRLHTGLSDASIFLALEPSTVSVVDSAAVVFEVTRRRPDLASRLFEPFALDRFDAQAPGDAPYHLVPPACRLGGRVSLRWARAAVESAQRFPEVPRLGTDEIALLDLVEEVAADPRLTRPVRLAPGDVLLVHDHAVLQRHEVPEPRVLRLWLTLDRGRRLPPGYLWPNPSYGGLHGRGGVLPCDVVHL